MNCPSEAIYYQQNIFSDWDRHNEKFVIILRLLHKVTQGREGISCLCNPAKQLHKGRRLVNLALLRA